GWRKFQKLRITRSSEMDVRSCSSPSEARLIGFAGLDLIALRFLRQLLIHKSVAAGAFDPPRRRKFPGVTSIGQTFLKQPSPVKREKLFSLTSCRLRPNKRNAGFSGQSTNSLGKSNATRAKSK